MMNDYLAGVIRRSNENVLHSYASEHERFLCSSIGMGCILLEVWRSGPWERGVIMAGKACWKTSVGFLGLTCDFMHYFISIHRKAFPRFKIQQQEMMSCYRNIQFKQCATVSRCILCSI